MRLKIIKNTESAPNMGSIFGQDVEPKGTYVREKINDLPVESPWIEGKVEIENPLYINVTDDTLVSWKYDLSNEYKAKGQKLTDKLMRKGYDAIITTHEDNSTGEIILFPNSNFMLSENKILIKKLLRESLDEAMMVDEDYPLSFNMEEFKSLTKYTQRVRYCDEHLKKISSGSARVVYLIDNEKVLKLAKNNKGLAQCGTEIEWGGDSYYEDILANTIDSHPDNLWVEMELAKKVKKSDFKRIEGINFDSFGMYLKNFESVNKGGRNVYVISPEEDDFLANNDFTEKICSFMLDSDSPPGDLSRANSFGIVKRDGKDIIVIIDFGLTNSIYSEYYK